MSASVLPQIRYHFLTLQYRYSWLAQLFLTLIFSFLSYVYYYLLQIYQAFLGHNRIIEFRFVRNLHLTDQSNSTNIIEKYLFNYRIYHIKYFLLFVSPFSFSAICPPIFRLMRSTYYTFVLYKYS